ncbi:hypothetical protein [Streptomyces sp. NBC_01022]|uniref:hypothetical protein n=1 Tax=Streptomyces sp. NBC_01022 TaxID=2903723 RepID=UPI002DDBF80C|nr:hypothetical protein [Streptomyces sp. NBC_01022]WRZ80903.1 hypothetical protein OG316_11775 [Streptomyces sp. NBC_01022]
MKNSSEGDDEHSSALDRVSRRTLRYLRVLLKHRGRQSFDLGYEALRGAAYQAGSGLVTVLVLWMSTRR